eukprot:1680350-Prymnesium_polylepis.1
MLCRDRTSRVELASAQCRPWSEGKRPTRSFTVSHSDHKRAVNRLPPRCSPSRHGALRWRTSRLCRSESQLLSRRESALVSR